ncbi:hypothetical protein BSL78_19924 [Apostichopus japonicus]|uniref:P2X purinoreceptor 7 intracellular domain-containing protein n=1 Tax=Stichopus japonicus TaxID=307972 RepID=A0A2G8K5K9_STIJA|nr:hypothetical protein BSL78_19924 [Apostichopus japonicus]
MAAGGIDKEYSDNEEGIEMEDMVDDRGEVFPYMFEPETSGEETGSDSDVEINRLNGTQCKGECRCCREIGKVRNVMDEEGATCITLHPGFEAVCLNPWVLQTAYYVYRQQYGGRAQENSIHDWFSYDYFTGNTDTHAYRQLVRMCWQFLGKEVRVVLPSCAVRRIRAAFPSEQYEGFKLPRL